MFGYHIISQQSWSHRHTALPCSLLPVPGKKFINGMLLDGLEQDMGISLGHCVPSAKMHTWHVVLLKVSNTYLILTIMWLAKYWIDQCYILEVGGDFVYEGYPEASTTNNILLFNLSDKIVFAILLFTHITLHIYIKFSCYKLNNRFNFKWSFFSQAHIPFWKFRGQRLRPQN